MSVPTAVKMLPSGLKGFSRCAVKTDPKNGVVVWLRQKSVVGCWSYIDIGIFIGPQF